MSDLFKEILKQKKAEVQNDYEKSLVDYCKKTGCGYIGIGELGRAELEEDYKNYLEAERLAEKIAQEKSETEQVIKQYYEHFRSEVPPRYKDADISQLNMGKQAKAIVDGASGLILGSNGPGKTHFVWAVVKEWAKKGESFKVFKAQKLLSDIKIHDDSYGFIERTYKRGVHHLVIDEIDKIFESKADYVYLNYLIDMRYEWMLQTVVVGNGDKESFIGALGQSIFSRLVGDGGVFIQHNGEDRRLPSSRNGQTSKV